MALKQPCVGPPPMPLPSGPGDPLKLCRTQPCPFSPRFLFCFSWMERGRKSSPVCWMGPRHVSQPCLQPWCWLLLLPTGSPHGPQPWAVTSACLRLLVKALGVTWHAWGRALPLLELPSVPCSLPAAESSCSLAFPIRTYIPFLKCVKQLQM